MEVDGGDGGEDRPAENGHGGAGGGNVAATAALALRSQYRIEEEVGQDDWYELEEGPGTEGEAQHHHHHHRHRHHHHHRSRRHKRKKKSCWQKFKDFLRSAFAFVFSSGGICFLVIVYLLMGAYAFVALEASTELANRSDYGVSALRAATAARLWRITRRLNVLHPDDWIAEVRWEVRRFQAGVVSAAGDGYSGQDVPDIKWTFSGSLLYSITVITTIGKGHFVTISTKRT